MTFQRDGDPIYDGRYVATIQAETRAPPIQVYHQDFGHFLDDLTDKDLEVPTEVVRATSSFMGKASGIYKNEEMRRSAIRPKLLDVISVGMEKIVNLDSTSADGMVVTQALMIGEVAAIGIEEDKNEFGDGGSDPSTQAGLSYGRFWAQSNVRTFKYFFLDCLIEPAPSACQNPREQLLSLFPYRNCWRVNRYTRRHLDG
jgi:hypothetical protein